MRDVITSAEAGLLVRSLPGVDAVGLESRAARLASRSLKTTSKAHAIDLAIRLMDLTTLEGADTPARVASLCARARHADPYDPSFPPVAAVCVYPDLVPTAAAALDGSPVAVASVATAFPSGRASLAVKLADTSEALDAGAAEVDMVIDRGAFLSGRYSQVFDEVAAVKELCGPRLLKVILETGELGSFGAVSAASRLALEAGADMIKTSTGKVAPATPATVLVMLHAVRDFADVHGVRRGVKVSGGVRTTKDAFRYLTLVAETLDPSWLTPGLFRIGASTLLTDLVLQRRRLSSGRYGSPSEVPAD